MKRLTWLAFVVLFLGYVGVGQVHAGDSTVHVDVGNAITMGSFTYEDATIDVGTKVINPRLSAESSLGILPFGVGVEFAKSENGFDGEYDSSDGTIDVERTEMGLYARFGNPNGSNFKIGYKNFKYDMSNGDITKRNSNGVVTENDINGTATGALSTGIDAELTLAAGSEVQFAVGLGASYFMDAEYDWSYTAVGGSNPGYKTGSATLDAISVRVRPEMSFAINEQLRIYFNATLQASAWTGDLPEDGADYPGVDIYSAVAGGIRYTFGK